MIFLKAILLVMCLCQPVMSHVLKKRADDIGSLESVIQSLTQQVNSLTARLNQEVSTRTSETAALKASTGKCLLLRKYI